MFNYEKLEVWQEALKLADLVYLKTRGFPIEEKYGLAVQMRRAAVSISSNIAEGSSRTSPNDFGRFIEIAIGSVFEVASQSAIARRQCMITADDYREIYRMAESIGRMLNALRRSIA